MVRGLGSGGGRWRRLAVVAAGGLAAVGSLALASPAGATGYQSISATGPIESIALGDELSCQVSYVNDTALEFYPPSTTPGDCGTFLAVGGTLYAPDFGEHGITATSDLGFYVPFTPVSQTGVLGTGTAADPYRVVTVVDAGVSGLRLTETVSYVNGSNSYRIDTSVANLGGSPLEAVLYHAGDCYASGSDIGYGFTRDEVGTAGCSQTAQNAPPARTVQMAPLSAGSQYYEARYDQIWEWIATRAAFPSTCRCEEHIDNGVGLSWILSFGPGTSTSRALSVSFTEETPAPPGLDSDGDALPDQWEQGNAPSADYENLATLGADPARRDVFVHLDYMEGCQPPAGWERRAIDVFAEHGIALHVDSGPTSLNADGQPWGTRSRAGGVPYVSDLPLWADYDRLKDHNFVPSNRRRAFHYALIVNKFDGTDGGQSRGIPEADFILSGCSLPKWMKVSLKQYIGTVFVHELGHNLNLRHGGSDDENGKPNYFGIMNYAWAFVGGIGKGGQQGGLPSYSWYARPDLDERKVDERQKVILPVAWNCPGSGRTDFKYQYGKGAQLVDWNCNGIYNEPPYRANLNSSWNTGEPEKVLTSLNDWRALSFAGGGVLGRFDLPLRSDPVVVPELTVAEYGAAQRARKRNRRQARRRLMVESNRYRVRPGRVAKLRITVRRGTGKGKVRGARLRVRGGRLIGRQSLRTGKRGRVVLRVRPKRRGKIRIFAKRRGFERGGLVITVRRKTPKR
jgi:hypothetical protein